MIYALLTGICWTVFIAVWLVSAFSAKRTVKRSWSFMWWRLAIVVVLIWLIHIGSFNNFKGSYWYVFPNPLAGAFGLLCCVTGIALAVWARMYLGRNWGMPMSLKDNPELVMAGPYTFVRHPIYTGVLLAMFGTILTVSIWWVLLLVTSGGYFIYSATEEEKIITKEFPDTYPAYKKRTKMLIPFVF